MLSPSTLAAVAAGVAALLVYERVDGDQGLLASRLLGGLAILLLIVAIAGARTRCPGCGVRFRRKLTRTETLGERDITKREKVSQSVYDSSGKLSGSTSHWESVSYTRTESRYHYQCKTCSHVWSVTGVSDRRA
ncbi:MAG: hypothetical protein NT062_36130 [Proteobacteria bacterium]|nr:hypothetical protein [Pseudomonadota bacterium]